MLTRQQTTGTECCGNSDILQLAWATHLHHHQLVNVCLLFQLLCAALLLLFLLVAGICKKGCVFGHHCKTTSDCLAGECNVDQRICMCPRGKYISPDNSACLSEEELCFNGAKDAEESDVDCE